MSVYDETGEIANESITSKLYYITMISLFISTLNPLDKTFKKQRKLAFNQDDVIDTHHIGMVPDSIYKAWIDVRKAAAFVRRKKQWDEQDLASLLEYWRLFWNLYKDRALLLMMLPNQKYTRKEKRKAFSNLSNCILYEGYVVYSLFHIKEFNMEKDPHDLEEWIQYNRKRSMANQRKVVLSTKADHQSHQILTVILYVVIYLITPLFAHFIYKQGFVHLFMLSLIYAVFFALYYTNIYRLKQSFRLRMSDIWQTDNIEENKPLFYSESISINMGVATFYVTIASLTMFIFQIFFIQWDIFAKSYLLSTIILLIFNFWFPYSPFVEKIITFYPQKIRIGHRVFPVSDLVKITVDKAEICYSLYLTYTKEPYKIRIENDFQKATRKFMKEWSEKNEIIYRTYDKKLDKV